MTDDKTTTALTPAMKRVLIVVAVWSSSVSWRRSGCRSRRRVEAARPRLVHPTAASGGAGSASSSSAPFTPSPGATNGPLPEATPTEGSEVLPPTATPNDRLPSMHASSASRQCTASRIRLEERRPREGLSRRNHGADAPDADRLRARSRPRASSMQVTLVGARMPSQKTCRHTTSSCGHRWGCARGMTPRRVGVLLRCVRVPSRSPSAPRARAPLHDLRRIPDEVSRVYISFTNKPKPSPTRRGS